MCGFFKGSTLISSSELFLAKTACEFKSAFPAMSTCGKCFLLGTWLV